MHWLMTWSFVDDNVIVYDVVTMMMRMRMKRDVGARRQKLSGSITSPAKQGVKWTWLALIYDLIYDFVYGGFLVSRASDNVFVVGWNVTTEHGWGFFALENGCTIGCSPGIEKIIFACWNEPFATVCKLERQDTGFVQMQLILVRLGTVKHFNIAWFHTNSEPFARRTIP